jgi:hypothetical protein
MVALVSLSGVRAEETKPAMDKPAAKADKPETELEKTMDKMSKAWRAVRKDARAGNLSPATATYVATVRANAELAEKMTPALEADQPVASRAKFQADYEAKIQKLVDTLTKLEAALKASDTTTATKLISDVGDLMKSGHHEFKKPEKKD